MPVSTARPTAGTMKIRWSASAPRTQVSTAARASANRGQNRNRLVRHMVTANATCTTMNATAAARVAGVCITPAGLTMP